MCGWWVSVGQIFEYIRIFEYLLPSNGYSNMNIKNFSKRIYSDIHKFPERYLNIFDIRMFKYFWWQKIKTTKKHVLREDDQFKKGNYSNIFRCSNINLRIFFIRIWIFIFHKTNIFDIRIRPKLNFRIYSYSYSARNSIFVPHWTKGGTQLKIINKYRVFVLQITKQIT